MKHWCWMIKTYFRLFVLVCSVACVMLKRERLFSVQFLYAIHGLVDSLHIHSSFISFLINTRVLIRMGKENEKTQSMHWSVVCLEKKKICGQQYNKKSHN